MDMNLKVSLSLIVVILVAVGSPVKLRPRRHAIASYQYEDDLDTAECPISEEDFIMEYSAIIEDMEIMDPQTKQSCSLAVEASHEDEYGYLRAGLQDGYEVCQTLFNFSQRLLVGLNATPECCLSNSSHCKHNSTNEPMDKAKAYGFGTLMVVVLSLLSLLGVLIVPLAKRCSKAYEYINLFLVALGTSALLSDAVLHLIPGVFQYLMEQYDGEDDEGLALAMLWRACAVMGGAYMFFIFETLLHKITHSQPQDETQDPTQRLIGSDHHVSFSHNSLEEPGAKYKTIQSGNGHLKENLKCACKCDIKPLAVLVIFGDSFHNFTDGLALGAAISQNLALGVGTIVALVFHEIPHELGDYAILLSTGMRWYVALLFNFISSLTALAGFFVGVSVGLASQQANNWMLAVAAGTFLYVSLVDLLPLIISNKLKGSLAMFLTHLGFLVSFGILLLVALFEDKFSM